MSQPITPLTVGRSGAVTHATAARINPSTKIKERNVNRTVYSGLAAVILGTPFGVSLTAQAAPLDWARAKQVHLLRAKRANAAGSFCKAGLPRPLIDPRGQPDERRAGRDGQRTTAQRPI